MIWKIQVTNKIFGGFWKILQYWMIKEAMMNIRRKDMRTQGKLGNQWLVFKRCGNVIVWVSFGAGECCHGVKPPLLDGAEAFKCLAWECWGEWGNNTDRETQEKCGWELKMQLPQSELPVSHHILTSQSRGSLWKCRHTLQKFKNRNTKCSGQEAKLAILNNHELSWQPSRVILF